MTEPLMTQQLKNYLDSLVPERHKEMHLMETYARQHSFPIIGPSAGNFCYQTARIAGATQIFEMGSGYGYSTAWFARAVQENGGGTVHHVVWDADLSIRAQKHLAAMGYDDIVRYTVGEAIETLSQVQGPFDLIFNDIDKYAYPESLAVMNAKLRPGGVLIIDNMLYSGRVFDNQDQSVGTAAIRELTRLMISDDQWITTIVPIRDGLMVAYKK